MKDKIIEALAQWVIDVAQNKTATDAEISALASVAKVVLDHPIAFKMSLDGIGPESVDRHLTETSLLR